MRYYPLTDGYSDEEDTEIVDILIDSSLYLDMDLAERFRLVRYLAASYYHCSSK